ncbi:MAG: DEAD/DEAH box helicase [Chloroflexi bacterium]|nr:DEAD/DEAH box helicase [Chloroflexota bacterium]
MDSAAFLRHLQDSPEYKGQIAHIERIPARPPVLGQLDSPLDPRLRDALARKGIAALYAHQAEAVNKARRGLNVIVTTSSASGKTLCYNLAALEKLLAEPRSRALYLFPTRALAQDQLRSLREMFGPLFPPELFATFDGDTPRGERALIKRQARVILTNPDMLHLGILPNHQSWPGLFRHLKYVVVDEAHSYRGVFGSHVACMLRRLRRACALHGSRPQFILASATIANPRQHAEALVNLPFEVVDSDGSPHGAKDFVFWDPPLVDAAKSLRRSASGEATGLFTELVSRYIHTLAFARTRRLTELMYIYARQRLEASGLAGRIKPYRAGYLAEERRRIEREFFNGDLLGMVSTNALELGIDSGGLDATVLTGYPGSIASTWQQAGRSGRDMEESLSFLVATDSPIDQYLMRHPEFFFGKGYESALVNPGNPYILRDHLLCAAWEYPLDGSDAAVFGPAFTPQVKKLEEQGKLKERKGRSFLAPSLTYPAQAVNLRSASGESFNLVDASSGALLETIEGSVAFFQIHPGAIYLHQGDAYLVSKLDLVNSAAYAAPTTAAYYTQTRELTDLKVLKETIARKVTGVDVYLGEVEVTTMVIGFKKKAQFTDEVLGEEPLHLPPRSFATVALWFDLPPAAERRILEAGLDYAGGLHAAEHAAIGILPLFALCDRNDIGGVSTPLHPDTGRPQVFIYDAHPGGIGIAEKGFDMISELWEATLRTINECPCEEGCPSCIQSPKCGNNNKPLDKAAARIILEELLSGAQAREGVS